MTSSKLRYAPFGIIGGILSLSFIFITSFYGAVFIYGPVLPLMFVWPWLFRRVAEVLASTWQTVLVAIYEKVFRTKIVVTGDSIERHEKTVVLMNHRTRIDWMFFFPVVFHLKILNRQKIALKSALKRVPGIGWAMQVAAYIFLDRNWETDQDHIDRILSYFVELDSKPNILFFPEGTDLSEDNRKRSAEFAKKKDLPVFDYVLHPRTKGFTYFVNTLREISGIHAVHDVTIAYPYNLPQGEKEMLLGEVPREVHFHIKRHSISELPKDEEKLANWCQKIWANKEELLKEFYSEPNHSLRKFKSKKKPPYHPRSWILWLALISWVLISIIFTYLLIVSQFARFYAFMLVLFYLTETVLLDGIEKMEMIIHEMRKPKKLWGKKGGRFLNEAKGDAKQQNIYQKYLNNPS
ncbi:lysocardiolipin acyltransferase 1-like [Clavelina lepadiformis]|uniref:Phospholipid/glycerol acyltransferase domain-containing protein n=1 Tax=Clavelina lepadiformis TaxID=159417 RepID=A0ABP0G431_CLALP